MAGRASVELHTLIFFRSRQVVADARVTKASATPALRLPLTPAGRGLLSRIRLPSSLSASPCLCLAPA